MFNILSNFCGGEDRVRGLSVVPFSSRARDVSFIFLHHRNICTRNSTTRILTFKVSILFFLSNFLFKVGKMPFSWMGLKIWRNTVCTCSWSPLVAAVWQPGITTYWHLTVYLVYKGEMLRLRALSRDTSVFNILFMSFMYQDCYYIDYYYYIIKIFTGHWTSFPLLWVNHRLPWKWRQRTENLNDKQL